MRALVIDRSEGLTLRDVPFAPAEGDCTIRVTTAGICGTDLQLLAGYADFVGIPGHEFVGVVDDAPAADARWLGARVVGDINVGCGTCSWCRSGVKEHCPNRTVVGIRGRSGAFAERLSLPASNLHALPDSVTDHVGVFVEPVAAACRILEQVPIAAHWRVAVVGDGRLGMLTSQVLKSAAGDVTLFGRHRHKLDIARRLGITIGEPDCNHDEQPDSTDHAGQFDLVVDATGKPSGLTRAVELARPRGTIVLKSTFHGEARTALWPVAVHELTIVGSRCGPFDRAIELLSRETVRVEPLISQIRTLDEHETAFQAARRELKVLFSIDRVPGVPGVSGVPGVPRVPGVRALPG